MPQPTPASDKYTHIISIKLRHSVEELAEFLDKHDSMLNSTWVRAGAGPVDRYYSPSLPSVDDVSERPICTSWYLTVAILTEGRAFV